MNTPCLYHGIPPCVTKWVVVLVVTQSSTVVHGNGCHGVAKRPASFLLLCVE